VTATVDIGENVENEGIGKNNMDLSKSVISKNTSWMVDASFISENNVEKVMESLHVNSVWQNDEVSPASYLLSHKKSNPFLHWDQHSTSRLFPVRDASQVSIEVLIHQDDSVVHIKDSGQFLSHYQSNCEGGLLRSFTCETIPFTVSDCKEPQRMPRVSLQEILVNTYVVLN